MGISHREAEHHITPIKEGLKTSLKLSPCLVVSLRFNPEGQAHVSRVLRPLSHHIVDADFELSH